MSRVQVKANPRIEVTVRAMSTGIIRFGNPNWEQETFERSRQIIADIERHVDDVEAALRFDVTWNCSLCGWEWEVDEETGEPACCDAAQVEWRAAS